MATAYTPGLTVTAQTVIRKMRRLPLKGQVLAQQGQRVEPSTIVARAELPGPVTTVRASEKMGMEPPELKAILQKKEGDSVEKGEVLAEHKSFFGMFKTTLEAPVSGTIEYISEVTGNLGIRHVPTPLEVTAYIRGVVTEVMPEEGAMVEAEGAFIQGIFGVGGERQGQLVNLASSPDDVVPSGAIRPEHKGKVLAVGSLISGEILRAAAQHGVIGLVGGGIVDTELKDWLGFDIGVAITGNENIGLSVVVTEGFGQLAMAKRTLDLLQALEGRSASLCGATQIRAGVIRPEVIIPSEASGGRGGDPRKSGQILELGSPIRIIREPQFGKLGTVVGLPPGPIEIETGAVVRVLEAELADGSRFTVPRANVEIIET